MPNAENRELCGLLRGGVVYRKLLRTLAKDMVTLYKREYTELLTRGVLTPTAAGIAILEDDYRAPRYYDPDCGIVLDGDTEVLICGY